MKYKRIYIIREYVKLVRWRISDAYDTLLQGEKRILRSSSDDVGGGL